MDTIKGLCPCFKQPSDSERYEYVDPPVSPPPSLNGPRLPPARKPPPPPRPLDPVLDSLAPPVPARRGETKDTMVSRDQMVDISVYQLGDRIDELCHSPNGFKQEYMKIGAAVFWERSRSLENTGVPEPQGETTGSYGNFPEKWSYIDATYMKGYPKNSFAFLITSAPTETNAESFWRFVWEVNAGTIVSLLTAEEMEKQACFAVTKKRSYGKYVIEMHNEERFIHYESRDIILKHKGNSRRLQFLHYKAWPEAMEPVAAGSLLRFRQRVRQSWVDGRYRPVVMFCSSTFGRCGSYVAMDNCIAQGQHEKFVNIFRYTVYMRGRRVDMTQTLSQYRSVYMAVHEGACVMSKYIEGKDVMNHVPQMFTLNSSSGTTKLEDEFQLITSIQPRFNSQNVESVSSSASYANPYALVDPDDLTNSIMVDGAEGSRGYIICKIPGPQLFESFWKLVVDKNCATLVVMDDMQGESQEASAWPLKRQNPVRCGNFNITTETDNRTTHYRLPTLHVTHDTNKGVSVHSLKQFVYMSWSPYETTPSNPGHLLQMLREIHSWQDGQNVNEPSPIIIVCKSGVQQSGLLCACSLLVREYDEHSAINIFNIVQHLRQSRSDTICNLIQYKFLYEFVIALCG